MFSASTKSGRTPTSTPDPQFNYVSALFNGNGTNGAQNNTFVDSSTNNFTVTRNGNTTQGSFSPYGGNWSNYFNGTSDWLAISNTTALDLPGAFTIECWFNTINSTSNQALFGKWDATPAYGWVVNANVSGQTVSLGYGNSGSYVGGVSWTAAINANTWYHLAITRSGTTVIAFLNGVQLSGTYTISSNLTASAITYIGRDDSPTARIYSGYISNFRIVKGTALYTANFTPPTAPLTAITNTSLLTCADNRFIDDSANNFAITVNGNTSIQRFNPFGTSTSYSTSVIGGSAYFDGTGDYLSNSTNNAALALGSQDFTLEFWINCPTTASALVIYDNRNNTSISAGGFNIYHQSGTIYIYGGSTTNVLLVSGSIGYSAWNHVAIVRNGNSAGNIKLYINGVLASIYGSADTNNYSQGYLNIGCYLFGGIPSNFYSGYITNFRIVKGTAVYTANFTPPTAPLTAITNTSLLVNMINAGIYDSAMISNTETVGNAQVSTSVVKYGTSSMAFNGAGDYLYLPPNPNNALGTKNFTLEFWVYATATPSDVGIFESRTNGLGATENGFTITAFSSSVIRIFCNGILVSSTGTSYVNTWCHVAVVRSSGTWNLYINGVSQGTASASRNLTNTDAVIGAGRYNANSIPSAFFQGYIDDLRITNGFARYTANFTPPTAELPTTGPV